MPAAFTPTLDGRDIVSEFGTASVVASQDTVTSFGDRVRAECQPVLAAGSELDQMFVQDGSIDVAITGNLEGSSPAGGNQNQLVLFLDTIPDAGEATLDNNAGRIYDMIGDTLPMNADFALIAHIWDGTAYVHLINLITNEELYIGSNPLGSGEGELDNGGPVPGWQFALNNSNVQGVNDIAAQDPINDPFDQQISNAQTATTGFEISIPPDAVGSPAEGEQICLFAIITNSYAGYLSNQILPAGLGGDRPNFGGDATDLALAGYSCLTTYIGPPPGLCNDPRFDTEPDGDVDQDDFAELQKCFTGPGGGVPAGCGCFDWNPGTGEGDGDIDTEDWGLFEICASGPGISANAACDDVLIP
jgi:hypothetical protein